MFTGLVQAVGIVAGVQETAAGVRLVVDTRGWGHRAHREESIAVNGCCLTVANEPGEGGGEGGRLEFDVVHETLSKTTMGGLRAGSRVNLEHAATVGTLMGGHLVQGHVDGVGEVVRVERGGGEWRVRVRPKGGAEVMQYIVPKGSVCVEGVSLTVAAVEVMGDGGGWFEVALIPVTLERTTLGDLEEGALVNLETDVIAKTVVHWVKHYGEGRGHGVQGTGGGGGS